MRGATKTIKAIESILKISIHTPHAGSDPDVRPSVSKGANFNPHSPCGERRNKRTSVEINANISIHTPHAGSDLAIPNKSIEVLISIHTPHAGSDP